MAINTPKALARGAFPTSTATLYTVPASTTAIITSIVISNSAATAATFTLVFDTFDVFKTVAISANQTAVIDMKQVLGTTKLITGFASAVTVNYHISGVESV